MRKKTLGTLVAGGALLLVGAGLGIRLWANQQVDTMPLFGALHQAPDGRILIELADTLYIESQQGQSLDTIPLSRLGVSNFTGDFAILADNTIILQKGKIAGMSTHDFIRALARTGNQAAYVNKTGNVPLQRCDLKTYKCQTLSGTDGDYFTVSDPFKLAVDEAAQRILVADTDRQRLVLLDFSGKILSTMGGLQFPNELQITGPELVTLADTNDGEVRRYSYSDDRLKAAEGGTDLGDWMGIALPGFFFPTGYAKTDDGTQWLLIADGALRNGVLYRWGADNGRPKPIILPRGDDVFWVAPTDGGVMVPDNAHYKIWQFANDGTLGGYFSSPQLDAVLADYAGEHRLYKALYSKSLWVMLLIAFPMLIWAWRLQTAIEDDAHERRQSGPQSTGDASEEVAVAKVSAASATPVWQANASVARSGEGEFRRYQGLNSPANNVGVLALITVMLVLSATILGVEMYWVSKKFTQLRSLFADPILLTLFGAAFLYVLWAWSSIFFERVYVTPEGIRYRSILSGPLFFLNFLWPSWQLPWREITDVKIRKKGRARTVKQWFYVITDRQGETRRISALVWRKVGKMHAGMQIRYASFEKPERLREAIHSSVLYEHIKNRGKI